MSGWTNEQFDRLRDLAELNDKRDAELDHEFEVLVAAVRALGRPKK